MKVTKLETIRLLRRSLNENRSGSADRMVAASRLFTGKK